MSGKIVKWISLGGCVFGAVVCVVMAFAAAQGVTAKVMWLLFAAVFLILTFPLYQIGNIMEALLIHDDKLRLLANNPL